MPKKSYRKRREKPELRLSPETIWAAKYIAKVVRNEIEDFHTEYLSDAQMKELNPLIRNAICTALHALEIHAWSLAAKQYIYFNSIIPDYWEEPELTKDFRGVVKYFEKYGDEGFVTFKKMEGGGMVAKVGGEETGHSSE